MFGHLKAAHIFAKEYFVRNDKINNCRHANFTFFLHLENILRISGQFLRILNNFAYRSRLEAVPCTRSHAHMFHEHMLLFKCVCVNLRSTPLAHNKSTIIDECNRYVSITNMWYG